MSKKIRTAFIVALLMVMGGAATFALVAYLDTPKPTHTVCVLTPAGELTDCAPAPAVTVVTCQEDMPCFDGSPKDSRVHTDASLSHE